MGEVRICRDLRLGRAVAHKVVQPEERGNPDTLARFLREARVQGQLEHPAIVPVYDLGEGPDGTPYFTMKRIRGVTLAEIIAGLRAGDSKFTEKYTRHKLLGAFASVCQAVEFAHARGVIHRDLKPGNLMLGDFGEVYVLDWGLAKLASAPDDDTSGPVRGEMSPVQTMVGSTLGTPAYMAPEQYAGQPELISAATDVYALGAILFELLTLQPLRSSAATPSVPTEPLKPVDARARIRAPELEIPPELEAICVHATATRPQDRFSTVRELNDAIERYLAGERDEEARRLKARSHSEDAARSAERALLGGEDALIERTKAMRHVGRALALDPTNEEALRTLVRLLSAVPRELPPETRKELNRLERERNRGTLRFAGFIFASYFLYVPVLVTTGIRNWGAFVFLCSVVALASAVAFTAARWLPTRTGILLCMVTASVMAGSTSLIFGPLILVPSFAAAITAGGVLQVPRRWRVPIIFLGCAALIVPALLEIGGVLPSYQFTTDALVVLPRIIGFPKAQAWGLLMVSGLATIVTTAVSLGRVRDAIAAAEEGQLIREWNLRQLLPEGSVGQRIRVDA
jgi:eukaryotic-like serine/threonine-protein kinase